MIWFLHRVQNMHSTRVNERLFYLKVWESLEVEIGLLAGCDVVRKELLYVVWNSRYLFHYDFLLLLGCKYHHKLTGQDWVDVVETRVSIILKPKRHLPELLSFDDQQQGVLYKKLFVILVHRKPREYTIHQLVVVLTPPYEIHSVRLRGLQYFFMR